MGPLSVEGYTPNARKAFVAQVCGRCQREIGYWNQRVAWARGMIEHEAVLLEVQTQPVGCTVLDLASGATLRSGAIGPADAPQLSVLLDRHPTPVLTCPRDAQ